MWVTSYSNNWKWYHSNLWVRFPICNIAFHSNYVLYHFWDKARYWSKIAIFSYPCNLHSTLPLGSLRRNIAIIVECGTTRIVWRPDDDKTVIRLAVLTQYQRVTDGQTDIVCDGRTDGHRATDGQTDIACDGRTDGHRVWQTDIVCDARTDGHRVTAQSALCIASRGKNVT